MQKREFLCDLCGVAIGPGKAAQGYGLWFTDGERVDGHSHGSLKRTVPHRFDVGCDVRQYPVSLEQLWAEAAGQEWFACDHHAAHTP